MFPEICKIGPITIYSYGLMLVVAFFVSVSLACRYAKATGMNPGIIFNLAFTAFLYGVIGARVFYVAENINYYIKNPAEIFMFQHGGLSWFGGLMFGSFAGILYLKKKKAPVYRTLDFIVPFVALAQGLGRIGCLLNGCCFGRPSSYGIYFPVHDAVLIPTQIFSSLLLVLIFIVLRYLQERPHREGEIFYWYLLLYSAKRFVIEFWRADNPVFFFNLTLFHILSLAVFIVVFLKLLILRRTLP